jgi:tRNA nucleotidyltransferase/poly(A) polymerase
MTTPDILHDLKQRDFTVNAMALAVHANEAELIDPLGGAHDLTRRCLRVCSDGAFEADPLRMLRAVRFSRQLSCEIEAQTWEGICRSSSLISRSAQERIKREFFTVLDSPSQEISLRELHACGLLDRLLPDIRVMYSVCQSSPHEYFLFEHCLRSVGFVQQAFQILCERLAGEHQTLSNYMNQGFEEGVSMTSLLCFAALLHDIGKPACAVKDGDRIRFYGHDKAGAKLVRTIAREFGLGRKVQGVLSCLVENHMRILQMSQNRQLTERAKIRFLGDCGETAAAVCLLAIADSLATGSSPEYQESSKVVRDLAAELCIRALATEDDVTTAPLLSGNDVISCLGLNAGPGVGDVLKQAAQLERDGVLQNREAALLWLKKISGNA